MASAEDKQRLKEYKEKKAKLTTKLKEIMKKEKT